MSVQQNVVDCPICGHKMARAQMSQGTCPACGVSLAMAGGMGEDILGSRPAAPRSPATTQNQQSWTDWIKGIALHSILWGTAGAAVGGAVLMMVCYMLMRGSGMTVIMTGASTGMVLGGILGGTAGAVFKMELEWLPSLLVGVIIGVGTTVVQYFVEYSFIAPPDNPVFQFVAMGLMAGLVAGAGSLGARAF